MNEHNFVTKPKFCQFPLNSMKLTLIMLYWQVVRLSSDRSWTIRLMFDYVMLAGSPSEFGPFMDYKDDDGALEEIKRKQDEELKLARKTPATKDQKQKGMKGIGPLVS